MAKFCINCGAPLEERAQFCPNCGTPVAQERQPEQVRQPSQPPEPENVSEAIAPAEPAETENAPKKKRTRKPSAGIPVETEKISENISLFSDGKYRWRYDLNLLTNPVIFILIFKIFFFIILGIFLFVALIDLIGDGFSGDAVLGQLKVFGIMLGVMTGLTLIGYLVYAAIMGGKYCVEFEMDEYGVTHTQTSEQAKKARKISALTVLGGVAAGRPSTVGVGLLSASKTSSASVFEKVRNVKVNRAFRVIKVNGLFEHNQVYAAKEDFDFVANYILEHCTNTKKYKRTHGDHTK